jgi:hypothetical protein
MDARKVLIGVAIVVWSAVALKAAVPRAHFRGHSNSNSTHRDGPVASCADLNTRFDGHRAVFQSEEKSITKAEAAPLKIEAEANGGLQVEGWDQDNYSVTLCKAAEAESELSQIHLTFQNGLLGVSGPSSHREWTAHLLIKAPKSASLDLDVNNGPVGLYHVDGNIKARAKNGPVTVSGCSGDLDLGMQNGPVTLEGNSGKLRIDAQNGPMNITLAGTAWSGSGFEAHGNNGPLTVYVPSGYQSGVRVESEGNGPVSCRASVCSEGRKNWDDERKSIEFGSGPTVIRLSTVNGPLSIR